MKDQVTGHIKQAFLDSIYQEAIRGFQENDDFKEFARNTINNQLGKILSEFYRKESPPGFEEMP